MVINIGSHWDLNGSLDRAEQIRQEGWKLAAQEILPQRLSLDSVEFNPEIFKCSLGLAGNDVIPALHAAMHEAGYSTLSLTDIEDVFNRRKAILTAEGYEHKGYPMREGAVETIRELYGMGIRLALVTSETESHAEISLRAAGIRDLFVGVVGRDTEVNFRAINKKPDPEPYRVSKARMEAMNTSAEYRHAGNEDTAPGMYSVIQNKRSGDLHFAIHSRDIQNSEQIVDQIAGMTQKENGGAKLLDLKKLRSEVAEEIDLTNASFEQIVAFYKGLRAAL